MARLQTQPRARRRAVSARQLRGPLRLDRRTKLLVRRLRRGDVALIDHASLDRVSAEDLIAAGVAAVLNCGRSVSDAYPNVGPLLLAEAGVPLIELPDDSLFERCREGDRVAVAGGEVRRDGELLARGRPLAVEELRAAWRERRALLGEALERFALNTIEHMREERELLGGRIALPRFATDFRERHALVVARGSGYLEDLRSLRRYIRAARPVIVAVDGAAEALLAEGLRPDMLVGDMDSAADEALRCGAELVVHAYPDGRAPGRGRLEALGLAHSLAAAPGTSEDLALLIAAEQGASLVVALGPRLGLVELLDRDRAGAASTILVRLRIGEILVDARGVSRLYGTRGGTGRAIARRLLAR
ncbi:MAG TPA: putative cytokinetic ring protein SteA [Solirubrobacteraceae bacterium]|nr:putative cytokinetic ring protein SteA [Solirubrobacteraceae bacterium]